jgi:hypothetical protein
MRRGATVTRHKTGSRGACCEGVSHTALVWKVLQEFVFVAVFHDALDAWA